MSHRQYSIISPRAALDALSLSELREKQEYYRHHLTTHDLLLYALVIQGFIPPCYKQASVIGDDDELEDVMSGYSTYTWRPDERTSG